MTERDLLESAPEQRNMDIATQPIRAIDDWRWLVKSSKGPGEYVVMVKDGSASCTCCQFKYRSHLGDCKHILAVYRHQRTERT